MRKKQLEKLLATMELNKLLAEFMDIEVMAELNIIIITTQKCKTMKG